MSAETGAAESTRDHAVDRDADVARWRSAIDALRTTDRERVVAVAGVVALAVVALGTGLRIAHNIPLDSVAVPPVAWDALAVGTPVVLALSSFAVALAARRLTARVGLLFVAAFGPLPLVSDAATLSAVVGVTGGGALAVVGSLDRPTTYRDARRSAVAAAFAGGVALSLGSAIGVFPPGARGLGGLVALAAVAAVGLFVVQDRIAAAAGAAAFVGIVLAGATSPFVTGSVLLIGFAVVGVPHLVVALAAAGGVAAFVAGVRRRDAALASGAGLLVFAGVPAALPRATAVVLGATLVVVGASTVTTPRERETDDAAETEVAA